MTDGLLPKLNKEDLAALIGDLSPEQRELLELLLDEDGVSLDDAVITSQPRQSDTVGRGYSMPLSYAQQRMWFLSQWEPDSPLYNIPSAVRLTGHVQVDLLEQAINEIVKRHEILRTTFDSDQGNAYQLIKPELDIKLTLVDLRDLAAENRHTEAMRLANEEAQRPFDLVAGPLIRTTLLQLSEQEPSGSRNGLKVQFSNNKSSIGQMHWQMFPLYWTCRQITHVRLLLLREVPATHSKFHWRLQIN